MADDTPPLRVRLRQGAVSLLRDAARTSWDLFKVMIPIILIIKLLQELDVIGYLGDALEPIMGLVGLPGETGLVWASALVVNLYGGIAVLMSLLRDPSFTLTTAQMTVLATIMLTAHALPLEGRICQKAGPRLRAMVLLRVLGALLLGWLLHLTYRAAGVLDTTSEPAVWGTKSADPWYVAQAKGLLKIFLIILALLFLLKLLKKLGATAWLTRRLEPVLRLLGLGRDAAPLAIIGMTLGLSYGGGLIIREAHSGHLTKRDIFFSLALMSLCHSLLEDTFLMMAIGGHWSGVLVARSVFALLAVFLLVRLVRLLPDATFDRWLFRTRPARPSTERSGDEPGL